jgi:UDP-N-acetylglucosamine enolpyruvyl transferase
MEVAMRVKLPGGDFYGEVIDTHKTGVYGDGAEAKAAQTVVLVQLDNSEMVCRSLLEDCTVIADVPTPR